MFAFALLTFLCSEAMPAAHDPASVPTLVAALKGNDTKAKWDAFDKLGKMGPAAEEAIPDLIELMEGPDEEMGSVLPLVLRRIGPKSVPSLVCALASHEPARRRHAAEALATIARFGDTKSLVAPIVPILQAVATQDPDPDVRMAATGAIASVGNKEALTALLAVLKDDDDDVRQCAVVGFLFYDPLPKPAVQPLLDLLGEPHLVGITASQALRSARDEDTARLLAKLLDNTSKSSSARCEAAELLGRLSPHAAIVVPALVRALQDRDADIRERAVWALEKLGPDAHKAAPALALLLSDANHNMRIYAARALYEVGGSEQLAVNSLIGESLDPDFLVRAFAVYELGQIGTREKAAVDALISHLADQDSYVRQETAKALKAVGRPAADKAIPELQRLLFDPESEVRDAAKKTLTDLTGKGPGEKEEE